MKIRTSILRHLLAVCVSLFTVLSSSAAEFASHPPIRPLPLASNRPLKDAPTFFVDQKTGDDVNPGTMLKPWKTLTHAVSKLRPGQTLVLRGGVYHEPFQIKARGTAKQPITIRSHPGELAIIDGGIPEFLQSPAQAWEPLKDGEFRSKRTFPGLGEKTGSTHLLGNFADSMIPLHGYRFITDLRSDNHKFHQLQGPKTVQGNGLYCGPGVFYDPATQRIHVRLAPTVQPSIGEKNNYRGETDPRKVPLIIAGSSASPIEMYRASHLILQDVVVRGSRSATINVVDCSNVTLDGVTSYGGSSALRVERTSGLRCRNCAFRGIAAPWLWRWSLKYRSIEARIVSASQWNPPARGNRDFEFGWCEFTDCVDGVFLGNVEGVSIHHCLLDNLSDDGFFLTCRTAYDGTTPGGDFHFHHNRISRVLSAFAFGVGHGRQRTIDEKGNRQLGKPTVIRQNVFDLREPVLYQQPTKGPITTFGRIAGDHGGPTWEPIDFVQNTVYSRESPWRNYYAAGWGKAMGRGTRRHILRNVFHHQTGMPGQVLPGSKVNLKAEQNLHWSDEAREAGKEEFLKRFRNSPLYRETGWTKGDVYAPPEKAPANVGAGKDVAVGVRGRLTLYGKAGAGEMGQKLQPFRYPPRESPQFRVALVLGYPAFDGPLLQYAFEKAGADVQVFERQWLPIRDYVKYPCVAILGSTVRAKMTPSGFAKEDYEHLREYLQKGGTLIIGRELFGQVFPGDAGRAFVESLTGTGPRVREVSLKILQPKHPWLSQFGTSGTPALAGTSAIRLTKGTNLIGDAKAARSVLADVAVGKGRLIYVGWDIARHLPHGRKPSTVQMETLYEKHYAIYERMTRGLVKP